MSDKIAPDALPTGWVLAPFQELAAEEPHSLVDGPFGSNLKTSHYRDEGPRVIRLQNVGDGEFIDEEAYISLEHFETLRKHEARGDDVVVAILGSPLPRACLVPTALGPAIVKADCVRLRVHSQAADPRFVKYAINSDQTRRRAKDLIHGVGRPRVNLRDLRTLRLPVAPLPEQTRIVEAIESYFTRLDNAVATLERVQANLKRYRASVLKAAVEGRLVPTEAELARQEGRDYEPASVLLERILKERRRRWEEAEFAALKAKDKKPKNDKWKAKYREPVAPDASELPELPEGWCWANIDQIGDVMGGLTKNAKRATFTKQLPYLRVANVYADELRLDDVSSIGIKDSEVERALLEPGDLLIVEGNGSIDQIGRVALWDGSIAPCVHQNHIIKARLSPDIAPPWVLRWLLSPPGRAHVERVASSTSGLHTLSLSKVGALPVPMPPIAEQGRIILEVERLLSTQEAITRDQPLRLAHLARLRQSILKWAFEGKLADQNPKDEPASALLERIKAEREARGTEGKAKTRKKRNGRKRSAA